MKTIALCVGVVGLAIAASWQTAKAPDRAWGMILAGQIERSAEKTLAKGAVEIRFGTTVIYADEADITNSAPGEASEIELRGTVRVKAVLQPK